MFIALLVLSFSCSAISSPTSGLLTNYRYGNPAGNDIGDLRKNCKKDNLNDRSIVAIDPRSDYSIKKRDDEVSNVGFRHRRNLATTNLAANDPRRLIYPNFYKLFNCIGECGLDTKNSENLRQILGQLDERTLNKIIAWTAKQLEHLYNLNGSKDFSGVNFWSNVNLSGKREEPFYAEEPHYVLIRREEALDPKLGFENIDEPFIPPRGRKQGPALDDLFKTHETFFPNRGKKDKIKDIFKYNDLFYPNRGKKRSQNLIPNYKIGHDIADDLYDVANSGGNPKYRNNFDEDGNSSMFIKENSNVPPLEYTSSDNDQI